jgi:hypothetical protein
MHDEPHLTRVAAGVCWGGCCGGVPGALWAGARILAEYAWRLNAAGFLRLLMIVAACTVAVFSALDLATRFRDVYGIERDKEVPAQSTHVRCEEMRASGGIPELLVEGCARATKVMNEHRIWRTLIAFSPHMPSGQTIGEKLWTAAHDIVHALAAATENYPLRVTVLVALITYVFGGAIVQRLSRWLRDAMMEERLRQDVKRQRMLIAAHAASHAATVLPDANKLKAE